MLTIEQLQEVAQKLRILSVQATTAAGSGHMTSALSCADIVAALFFHAMHFDPNNFHNELNDRFILSKGHAAPILYAAWHLLGKVSYEQLLTLRKFESPLEGHPTFRFPYAECATGSLGMGLATGIGMALHTRRVNSPAKIFVVLGDSECSEGSVYEAIELAAHYKLENIIAIVDVNRLGQRGETLYGHDMQRLATIWQAFGWHVVTINGHDMKEVVVALDTARAHQSGPVVILAHTYKGHGIELVENENGWHGKALSKDQLESAVQELAKPLVHAPSLSYEVLVPTHTKHGYTPEAPHYFNEELFSLPTFKIGDKIAPRKAIGIALAAIGIADERIMVLDAEVSNSTHTDIFAKEFPDRFIQCYIAEQALVSISVGLVIRGSVPFAATFGCFFTRAFDQLRMAPLSHAALRLIGTHVGVSIGQDGPSQMALEDIAMMGTIPNSIILYPADATCAAACVELMYEYEEGISYCRTTRNDLPVIYGPDATFAIGGCNILRYSSRDVALIVAAGVTLNEALKAYEMLLNEGMHVAVIDLYSVKPFDRQTVIEAAQLASGLIITVEDHYKDGGIGQRLAAELANFQFRIVSLAVEHLPRSGSPEVLLQNCQIDADAIVRAVRANC